MPPSKRIGARALHQLHAGGDFLQFFLGGRADFLAQALLEAHRRQPIQHALQNAALFDIFTETDF